MSELILYTTNDGQSRIHLRSDGTTVWLNQLEIAELFGITKQNVSLHLKNIFEDKELDEPSTVKESLTVRREGDREVERKITLYNLDAILAVGYRVRSPRGAQFRRWANSILSEYLVKGFVMDDQRLKNPDGRPDFFDEMLERIREIRASEKRFYQKVRDLFALSVDYDKTDSATQTFFATVQNMLIYAVTGRTAAELIVERSDANHPSFGLRSYDRAFPSKREIVVAKNYLTEDEVDTLNRLVVIFLETAELRTKSRKEIYMAFWKENVAQLITSNGFELLNDAGTVSRQQMLQLTETRFEEFEQQRRRREALVADRNDEMELQALEHKIQRRSKR